MRSFRKFYETAAVSLAIATVLYLASYSILRHSYATKQIPHKASFTIPKQYFSHQWSRRLDTFYWPLREIEFRYFHRNVSFRSLFEVF